ncbi:hypothetical protein O181_023644 [Austropuccinia psidii MF-1]|uniref:Uncharacterized protein n=1 Tax=Austropuccinia psidii MF-1 TaxID=1389203 RepID=A0A9Q3CET0_9BASI|nr:hypothetical protein [Austropuccinia psidii MF-1]
MAYINAYRRGSESRLFDLLAYHPGDFDSLQELIDIILEWDTRYHERHKKKGGNQEKNPPFTGFNSFRPTQYSSLKKPHHKKNFQVSKDRPQAALLNEARELIGSEKERRIKEGLFTYCGGNNPIYKCFKMPHDRLP